MRRISLSAVCSDELLLVLVDVLICHPPEPLMSARCGAGARSKKRPVNGRIAQWLQERVGMRALDHVQVFVEGLDRARILLDEREVVRTKKVEAQMTFFYLETLLFRICHLLNMKFIIWLHYLVFSSGLAGCLFST